MSQTTQSILKVVDINRLKSEKNQQVKGSTGVVTEGYSEATPSSPVAPTSFSEEFLKTETLYDSTMFHDTDSEFFQDLVQWCSTPAQEDQVLITDSKATERAYTIDTPNTEFSPQGWDSFDTSLTCAQAGFYNTTPINPLSPNNETVTFDNKLMEFPNKGNETKMNLHEEYLDINSLPIVIEEVAPERVPEAGSWPATEQFGWTTLDTQNTNYTKTHNTDTLPNINQEEYEYLKYGSPIPREMENNEVVISEYIVRDYGVKMGEDEEEMQGQTRGLSVDVTSRSSHWPNDVINTPEVLSCVEQLEKEKCLLTATKSKHLWPVPSSTPEPMEQSPKTDVLSPVNYEPMTPKSESHLESDHDEVKPHDEVKSSKRRRNNSEDSDVTYTPYAEQTTPTNNKKYKTRKVNIPIKDMIIALEGSQQLTKARRGRPPKRRESTVSSVCSVDENSSCFSNQEGKYRELRDKNNEASKRSRMNRKLKELQMEQLAVDLEERNNKLKIKADILEDMTKRLKDALMTAILQK